MHRWLLVLLVALLPLRGWVGEAMAGQMLQQRLAAIEAGSTHGHPGEGAGHRMPAHASSADEDCHGHAVAATASAPSPSQGAAMAPDWQADCPTCASCQVCSAFALLLPASPALTAPALSQPLPQGLPRLALAAQPAGLFKPPIS